MRILLIGLTAILFMMPGCGGGGSQSSNMSAPATKLRTVQSGDQWVYHVTGQSIPMIGAATSFTGTLTLALSAATFNGVSALELTTTLNVTNGGGQPSTSVYYLQQDSSTGDVQELGITDPSGTNEPLITPTILFPGTWSNSTAINTTLNFGGGNTQSYALNVTGSSTVNTPVGSFAVWTVSAGAGSGITEMWAPQLGAPVKITVQGSLLGTGSATAVLQSTTVPH